MCKITIEILEKLHRPSALSSLLDFNHQSHNVGKKSGKNLILASGSDYNETLFFFLNTLLKNQNF